MKSKPNGKAHTKALQLKTGALPDDTIAEVLLTPLRRTKERKRIHMATRLDHAAIERALRSSRLRRALAEGVVAYIQEQTAPVVEQIFLAARAKEAWACKVVLELARVAEGLDVSLGSGEASAQELALASAVERSLVENLLSLVRGETHDRASADSSGE